MAPPKRTGHAVPRNTAAKGTSHPERPDSKISYGAELIWDQSLILGEDLLQPHAEKSRRVPTGAFKGLDRYDELKPGDLLVHRDYGIARFGGLLRMETGSTANDFLLLYYSGDDRLYVPCRIARLRRPDDPATAALLPRP